MTALNLSTDIPSSINTVEKLAAWAVYVLATLNPQKAILEEINRSEYAAQAGTIKAADQTQRMILRLSLQLNDNYVTDNSVKLWEHAQELSGVDLPAPFKSN